VERREPAQFEADRFVAQRAASWNRLEELLRQVERGGVRSLGLPAARELAALYRSVSGDLLRARAEHANASVVDYLNDIVASAYAVVHGAPARAERDLLSFFTQRFPRLFRHEWRAVVLASAILALGAGAGAVFVATDPHSLGALIPEGHDARGPTERVMAEEEREGAHGAGSAAAFSGWLFTHNIQVTFLVFALGLTFGVGTAAVLFFNGVPLGALAMQYHQDDLGTFFWAWILPHGIPELTSVAIAGAAGLILARGLWLPGRRRRRDALRDEARTAALLVIGAMPVLVVAGLIEGTVSQMHEPTLPYEAKLAFAALVGAALYRFLLTAGCDQAR
jgi:uncharacterized membrane protein SpoIIM required for sporulation